MRVPSFSANNGTFSVLHPDPSQTVLAKSLLDAKKGF
jgi:hypothetical protein